MDIRRLAFWAVIAFIAWFIFTSPDAAAHVVKNIGGFLTAAAHSASKFITSV